jgi:hemerythrin
MKIHKIEVARGIKWVDIPHVDLKILCGCPADAVKHLIKRGLILQEEVRGVMCETGPNTILLSDIPVQNGEFANLAEFPVLQMLYKQGLILPGHPNNTGRKPLLIGSTDQVEAQMRYIYRGNYGLVSQEEMVAAGVTPERAAELMRLKLAFAFGRIQPSREILDSATLGDAPMEIASGVYLRRLQPNIFEFSCGNEKVTVDLNLKSSETYECPYPLGYRRFDPEYFAVIHSGEGDGWDINRPSMSSILTHQGRIYLIDAGPQLAHTMNALGIGIDQVDGIFHTHAHDDHFAGLTVLMRAGRRIRYFATPLVRASVAKKLTALLGIGEDRFGDFFDIRDLEFDRWNNIEGLEVKPVLSPHPVETNIYIFRSLWGDGYRSYAHFADIVSLAILERMINEEPDQPGISRDAFEATREAYLQPVDIKKIDAGGGMIHGDARDFRTDRSKRILLAHRAGDLAATEKEIGSSAAFGTTDVLIGGQSEGLRRQAFSYLEAHLPGVPLHELRMLLNHPLSEINPGAIILKEGEMPEDVMLLLSGRIERIRTRDDLYGNLFAGALIGDGPLLENRPSHHTYRASSFLSVMRLPPSLFTEVIRRNGLQDRRQHAASLTSFLDTTNLFGDGLPVAVLGRILDSAVEHIFHPGEEINYQSLQMLNIIRSGRVERAIGDRVLDVLIERDFFGEEGAIFKVPYLFNLRALTTTVVIQIPGELLVDVPILRWKLLEAYQQRAVRVIRDDDMPDRLHWNAGLSVHLESMDRHHERLVEIANAIIDNLGVKDNHKTLVELFEIFDNYTRHHCHAEERLMETYDYPAQEAHKILHHELMQQVTDYKLRITTGNIPERPDFQRFFETWLTRHIMEEDRKIGVFLNAKGIY